MGHYDNCREGYCAKCGAAPGNLRADGSCPFCQPDPAESWSLEKLERKRDQEWEMAGLAHQDRDYVDERVHETLARKYEEILRRRFY